MARALLTSCALVLLAGCSTQSPSPDTIRRDTANATSAAARDAKAVAQGVSDGLKENRTVDINKASDTDLRSLPGIDADAAHRIIAGRPYADTAELLHRQIISKPEYDRIVSRIVAR